MRKEITDKIEDMDMTIFEALKENEPIYYSRNYIEKTETEITYYPHENGITEIYHI